MDTSTYHRLVEIKRSLPQWLLLRLDPYNTTADRFVADAAEKIPSGSRVLDAGAGECRHAPLFEHTTYLGTDSGVGDAENWDYTRLAFLADLTALPLAEDCADVAISVNVLEHVPDPLRVLEEMRKALRPGGTLYLVAPQSWPMHQLPHDYFRFTRGGIEHLLERAGFVATSIEPIGGMFWSLGLRSLYLLSNLGARFFLIALLLAPLFGVLVPVVCFYLDRLDRDRADTLGYTVVAHKAGEGDAGSSRGAGEAG